MGCCACPGASISIVWRWLREGREFALKRFLETSPKLEAVDYIIIDTPPTPSIWMSSALIASDYFVIPVRPDPLSMIDIDLLTGYRYGSTTGEGVRFHSGGLLAAALPQDTL